jgi:hypothetical protein
MPKKSLGRDDTSSGHRQPFVDLLAITSRLTHGHDAAEAPRIEIQQA